MYYNHQEGGALDCEDANESYWYSVYCEWNPNGRYKYFKYNNELQLMMDDDTWNKKEVLYCHTNVAHKTLGVMIAPDDNNNQQVKEM